MIPGVLILCSGSKIVLLKIIVFCIRKVKATKFYEENKSAKPFQIESSLLLCVTCLLSCKTTLRIVSLGLCLKIELSFASFFKVFEHRSQMPHNLFWNKLIKKEGRVATCRVWTLHRGQAYQNSYLPFFPYFQFIFKKREVDSVSVVHYTMFYNYWTKCPYYSVNVLYDTALL